MNILKTCHIDTKQVIYAILARITHTRELGFQKLKIYILKFFRKSEINLDVGNKMIYKYAKYRSKICFILSCAKMKNVQIWLCVNGTRFKKLKILSDFLFQCSLQYNKFCMKICTTVQSTLPTPKFFCLYFKQIGRAHV